MTHLADRPVRRIWLRGTLACLLTLLIAACSKKDRGLPTAPEPSIHGSNPDLPSVAKPIQKDSRQGSDKTRVKAEKSDHPFRFTDVREQSGISFMHTSGMTEQKRFPTANGSGVAVFDYDGDGLVDLYFATGNPIPLDKPPSRGNRLYRNRGGWRFEDTTETSGLGFRGYCHGITVGDIDNDGDPDVFLSNYGGDVLYENRGDGTFRDISSSAGIARAGTWSSSAAFLDYDGDSLLDLYVSRYGDWQFPRDDLFCGDSIRKIRRYCSPKELRTTQHTLFRNKGDRAFIDTTNLSGVDRQDGHGFAVVAADLDLDLKPDLFVANDQDPRFLFLNRGDGRFRDMSSESGASYDSLGRTQSGMGVDAEDVTGDGLPELFVTNFQEEYNTLYRCLAPGLYLDATSAFGLAVDSLPWIGWGCVLADFDNDGWPDILVVNGHIDDNAELHGQPNSYEQPPLLHQNVGGKRFRLVNPGAGSYFETNHVGHGLAVGDLDNDGDLDAVVNHKDAAPALLRNDSSKTPEQAWIRLNLEGRISTRDAIGAHIKLTMGERSIHRLCKSGNSLMSSGDRRILIGMPRTASTLRLEIRWPSGSVSLYDRIEANHEYTVVEPDRE